MQLLKDRNFTPLMLMNVLIAAPVPMFVRKRQSAKYKLGIKPLSPVISMNWVGGNFFEKNIKKAQTTPPGRVLPGPNSIICNRSGLAGTLSPQLHRFFFFPPKYSPRQIMGCGGGIFAYNDIGRIRPGGGRGRNARQF